MDGWALIPFLSSFDPFSIELTRTYGVTEWREDLKKVLRKAGCEGKQVVFTLNDTQLVKETFLEDINNLLNIGEVPNLFPPDELATVRGHGFCSHRAVPHADTHKVVDAVRPAARELGRAGTNSDVLAVFVERCRANMHLVLCMSPIGDTFRNRLRQFPSLVNCCTIDWFVDWPTDALTSVAKHSLDDIDLDAGVREGVVSMVVYMHRSVQELAQRYKQELRRFFYVTPTSYLELINTVKTLLAEKRTQIQKSRRRYVIGLEKLESTAQSVKAMQENLNALKPQLIQTQKDTDAMMVSLQIDQAAAASKKEQVAAEEQEALADAARAESIRSETKADLAVAMPALEAAVRALKSLDKGSIAEVKAMKKPPDGVKLVMEAVCVMLGEPPKKITGERGEVCSRFHFADLLVF
jgi:dynein heavy chain